MVISHDRWFLDRICTHILAYEGDSQWKFFDGNFNEYEADKKKRLGEEGSRRSACASSRSSNQPQAVCGGCCGRHTWPMVAGMPPHHAIWLAQRAAAWLFVGSLFCVHLMSDLASTATPSDEQILADTRQRIREAVIGLNLCPFAKSVYVKNQVRLVVSRARHIDAFLDDLNRELELLRDTPAEQIDTTLLIHPTLFPDFLVFNDFLNVVDEVLEEHELEGIVQVAPFHPAFQFEGTDLHGPTTLTNRAPYPHLAPAARRQH